MNIKSLALNITGAGAQAAVNTANGDKTAEFTVFVEIASGSARSAQVEVSPDGAKWFPAGAALTTAANTSFLIPAAPFVRLNIGSNTGSTISAWIRC